MSISFIALAASLGVLWPSLIDYQRYMLTITIGLLFALIVLTIIFTKHKMTLVKWKLKPYFDENSKDKK